MNTEAAIELTAATYNIHRCVGADRVKDPARVAQVLDELDCDIVALQEVESHGPLGDDRHQLDYLCRCGGYQGVAGPTMEQPQGHYGNALLTRVPVLDVRRHVLDHKGREPRGALEARLDVDGRTVRAITTHLGLSAAERRNQTAYLFDVVAADSETPTVLLGDFNEWLPWSRIRRRLRRRCGVGRPQATFPSRWPLFALDHVCVRPKRALVNVEVVRTPLSRVASDHLPLRAEIEWHADPEATRSS